MRSPLAPLAATALLSLTVSLLPATSASAAPVAPDRSVAVGSASVSATSAAPRRAVPRLKVRSLAGGLDHPWAVANLPGEGLLVTERDRARLVLLQRGEQTVLDFPSDEVWVSGETGLLGLAADNDFADNRRFYTCQGGFAGGDRHDVRVVAWTLDATSTRAVKQGVLLRGIQATSGRHGGCRLLMTKGGALMVGTGDAAVGANPQDLRSLNGKTLRLDPMTGRPSAANPFATARNRNKRYVFTYGHRNVQGLSQRPDGRVWSVEHGTGRDDEVNLLRSGGNYGWNPVPGYDESTPMTDFSLPGKQRGARWSSGAPTVAPSGGAWIRGTKWGAYRGRLAVAVLKDQEMLFQRYDQRGRFQGMRVPRALTQQGRLRSVTQVPGGALIVTTDNGGGDDKLLRVTPARR